MLTSKITTSCSYRSLSKIFVTINLCLDLKLASPSFSTTMLWVKKIGYSRLQSTKIIADDWIIILDESIGIGQEKVLVVLGIRQCNIDFTRPLRIQDMEPILVKSRERWLGVDIADELREIERKLGAILYAVADAGNGIKNGLKESGILWRYDITHAIAIALDRIYRNDEKFKDFTHKAGQMRFKCCCSKQAHLIPPNQRSKSRFLNIDIISDWGVKALGAYDRNEISIEEREQLKWVKEMESFILELVHQFVSNLLYFSPVNFQLRGLTKNSL